MSKTDKQEFVPQVVLFVDKEVEPDVLYLYKVIDTSAKGGKPAEDMFFDSKEQAKIHRNNLNEEIDNTNFRYQVRKGPDHWKL